VNCRITLKKSRPDFAKCFEDDERVEKLAYLADTFHHMNQLNKSLQDPREKVFTSSDKFPGFKRKLNLWKNHVVKGNLESFPPLLGLEGEEVSSLTENHLEELRNDIKIIFLPFHTSGAWEPLL
jgi:hypothetical protein